MQIVVAESEARAVVYRWIVIYDGDLPARAVGNLRLGRIVID